MRERVQRVTRVIAGCAVLALASCGAGADRAGAATQSDAVASSQDALKSSGPKVTPQTSGTTSGLIAISAVDARVVWAVGRFGTYVITTDGGKTWHPGVVPGAETLQFRDVEAVSAKVAYLLSLPTDTIAPRIYKTLDGGKTWKIEFQAPDTSYFYDCFAFWDPWSGITLGDSINGRFPVIRTLDGTTWHDIGDRLPPALPGEAGFASSGTCAATQGHQRAWLTTGGTGTTRVFYTTDRGQTWGVTTAPITAGRRPGRRRIQHRLPRCSARDPRRRRPRCHWRGGQHRPLGRRRTHLGGGRQRPHPGRHLRACLCRARPRGGLGQLGR